MNFINPKIDFAFKKIFGDKQHKALLISFLNAILYANQPTIQDLEILAPYNAPKISGLKDTFLDVKAQLDNGSQVIIEMQVLPVIGFGKRVLYNVTKTYSAQLKPKENYPSLNPVIGLTITDFKMFSDTEVPGVLSRFGLYDPKNKIEYPIQDIELVFVELPKFTKSLSELETLTDKWLYFMRYASELEDIPDLMKTEPVIEQAFQIANRVNLSQAELDNLEQREFFVQDMHRMVEYATQKAEKAERRAEEEARRAEEEARRAEEEARRAEEEARRAEKEARRAEEEARRAEELAQEVKTVTQQAQEATRKAEEATRKAEEAGRKKAIIAIAEQLLPLLDDETISQKTGLTVAEVQQLRTGQQDG